MGTYSQIVVITDHRRDDPAKGEPVRKLYEFCKRELYNCQFSLCKSSMFDSIHVAYPKSATVGQLAAKFPTFGWEDEEHSGQGTVLLYREDQDDEWHGLHGDGSPLAHDVMPDLRTIDISEAGSSTSGSFAWRSECLGGVGEQAARAAPDHERHRRPHGLVWPRTRRPSHVSPRALAAKRAGMPSTTVRSFTPS